MSSGFLLIIVIMFAFMYLLLIRPQRTQQRRHREMLQNLKVGDEVITVGGIYGDVTGIEDEKVHLLIAEDVEVEVARRSIASVVPPEPDADADEADELEPAEGEEEVAEVTAEDGGRRPSA